MKAEPKAWRSKNLVEHPRYVKDEEIDVIELPTDTELLTFVCAQKGTTLLVENDHYALCIMHFASNARHEGTGMDGLRLYGLTTVWRTGRHDLDASFSGKELWRLYHGGIAGKLARMPTVQEYDTFMLSQNDDVRRRMKE